MAPVRLARDGSFRASGLRPGRYRLGVRPLGSDPALAPRHGEPLVVPEGVDEVRCEMTVGPAGTLYVGVADPRLPPPYPGREAEPTPEQLRFGAAALAEVRDASGRLAGEQRGLQGMSFRSLSWMILPPGVYRVRFEPPEGEPSEKTVVVEAGKSAGVEFGSR